MQLCDGYNDLSYTTLATSIAVLMAKVISVVIRIDQCAAMDSYGLCRWLIC